MQKIQIKCCIVLCSLAVSTLTVAGDYPIAGLSPSVRPVGAPMITVVEKDAVWYVNALKGITTPYPYHLRFLEDQGSWYTPFNHAGMPNKYDIRGWYKK